ncbi:unnamed protein product [Ambrosiozyma monospora]|uniref:Unnamed protein product n=1 Tax=Ambrosiozyma monospora TaxID=43982 RepID=A0ACB5T810_AMBMO|nr:unnamed protein product [Ambrosiozyma monospora]
MLCRHNEVNHTKKTRTHTTHETNESNVEDPHNHKRPRLSDSAFGKDNLNPELNENVSQINYVSGPKNLNGIDINTSPINESNRVNQEGQYQAIEINHTSNQNENHADPKKPDDKHIDDIVDGLLDGKFPGVGAGTNHRLRKKDKESDKSAELSEESDDLIEISNEKNAETKELSENKNGNKENVKFVHIVLKNMISDHIPYLHLELYCMFVYDNLLPRVWPYQYFDNHVEVLAEEIPGVCFLKSEELINKLNEVYFKFDELHRRIYYCKGDCCAFTGKNLKSEVCPHCEEPKDESFWYSYISPVYLLSSIMANKELRTTIEKRNGFIMSDLFHSELYKKIKTIKIATKKKGHRVIHTKHDFMLTLYSSKVGAGLAK